MALIIILIVLVLQRFLKWNSYSRQWDWATAYFQWMSRRIKPITDGHGLLGLAILVIPIVLVAAIIVSLVLLLFGVVGSGILQCVLVWYCFDARDIRKEPYPNASPEMVLQQTYQHLFAILFWYGLLGPVGLVLYVSVNQLAHVIETETLQVYFTKLQGILDWVPVRLLGLSFALVGNFGAVFKLWMKKLLQDIMDPQRLVIEWGQAAIKAESTEMSQLELSIDLLDRSLLVWLAVIFLVTIGVFLG